jgi:hypothetical protein
MTARQTFPEPVEVEVGELGDIDDFRECCADHTWFLKLGIIKKPVAVDNLQWLAERWELIDKCGQDHIQQVMASAFKFYGDDDLERQIYLDAYALRVSWEMADARDRWQHTGEQRPQKASTSKRRPKPYCPADSTADAFWVVVGLNDPDALKAWMCDHPRDAPTLLKLLENK